MADSRGSSSSRRPLRFAGRGGGNIGLAAVLCLASWMHAAEEEVERPLREAPPPAGVNGDRIRPLTGEALEKASAPLESVIKGVGWPDGLKFLVDAAPAGDREPDEGGGDAGEPSTKPAAAPVEAVKRYAAARHAAQSRRWSEALELLERAIQGDPSAARPRLLAGQIHAQLGRRSSAIESLTEALRRDPGEAGALYLLGRIHFERRDYDVAAALLARADAAEAADPNARYLTSYFLGQSLLRLDRDAAGASVLQRFLNLPRRFGRSKWHLRDLVLVSRQEAMTELQVGDALMRLGRPGEAGNHYERADLADRLGPAFVANRHAYALMLLGRPAEAMKVAADLAVAAEGEDSAALIDYVVAQADDDEALIAPLRAAYERSGRTGSLALALTAVMPAGQAEALLVEHLERHPGDAAVLERLIGLWGDDRPEQLARLAITTMRRQPDRAEAIAGAMVEASAKAGVLSEAVASLPPALSGSPTAAYLRGRLALAGGRAAEAARRFDAAIEASPEFLAARLAAAELLVDRAARAGGDRRRSVLAGRALERLEGASRDDDPRVRFLRARALAARNEVGKAADQLNRLLRDEPSRPKYLEFKADLLQSVGQFDQAERTLLGVVRSRPRRVSAYRALFELYERHRPDAGKFAELVRRAESAMPAGRLTRLKKARLLNMQGRADQAVGMLRDLVREDPDDPEALAAYTVSLGRSEGWPVAARKLEQLLDADPSNEAALTMLDSVARLIDQPQRYYQRREAQLKTRPRTPRTLGRLAALYERWGKVDRAIEMLDEALSSDPPAKGPLHLRAARLHQRAGRMAAALMAMERAIAAAPDNPHYAVVKAWLLQEAGRLDDAIATLEAAESEHPDAAADLRLERARVYAAADRTDPAMAIMETLIAEHPDRAAELYYTQALLPGDRGDFQRTERLLLKALDADPDFAPANNDLGYQWADRGRNLNRAERMVRKAVEAEPNNPAYLDSLGWVLYKRDLPSQAARWLERAADLRRDPIILDHLGDAYWRAGEREQAVEQWRTAQRRIVETGDKPDETTAALLDRLRSKLEAVEQGRPPEVAPLAESTKANAGASAASSPR